MASSLPREVKNVLVCGGAGYIGSHTVLELTRQSDSTVYILDNLSTGYEKTIPKSDRVVFINGDVSDVDFVDREVFSKYKIDAVMHFCALIVVPESVTNPLKYYDNNVVGTLRLLQVMQKHEVPYFIFSSTAAVFGIPETSPIDPSAATVPINPYGETKLVVERMLRWCSEAYGLKFASLRYFNACGADKEINIGECHKPESHLIPIILQVALGQRENVQVFGDDYNTVDGTCVRDYIHVTDLATAHIRALEYLAKGGKSDVFNLGSGLGYTVKEVVDACRKVTGHPIPAVVSPRRGGDPDSLVAGSKKAEEVLGWTRKYDSIEKIVETAWRWHKNNPHGFDHAH
ncbi:UDP-glucose 4-epimerase [Acrasis kona]|uniref:UDP-glucose 4-epimerase n=1 Tax=Acrasis kona TaxID=1008807 RepID=A0AAW2YZ30_9EUKA